MEAAGIELADKAIENPRQDALLPAIALISLGFQAVMASLRATPRQAFMEAFWSAVAYDPYLGLQRFKGPMLSIVAEFPGRQGDAPAGARRPATGAVGSEPLADDGRTASVQRGTGCILHHVFHKTRERQSLTHSVHARTVDCPEA
jgi:hypothetical protein